MESGGSPSRVDGVPAGGGVVICDDFVGELCSILCVFVARWKTSSRLRREAEAAEDAKAIQ